MARNKPSHKANAVVTGAGSGIGRAFTLALADRGGHVVCSDIDAETAEATAQQIRVAGGHATSTACDVTRLADVEKLADTAEDWFGAPADLVVNNAGIGSGGSLIGELPIEEWKRTLDINLWGLIHGCHVFTPRLRALGRGGLINVASTASFAAAPLMSAYNTSKAAALTLTETLAAELTGSGVRVTAVCPAFVKTSIVENSQIDGPNRALAERLINRGVSPERAVKDALAGYDSGQLYVLPQVDARLIWRFKRHLPAVYTRAAGLVNRFI